MSQITLPKNGIAYQSFPWNSDKIPLTVVTLSTPVKIQALRDVLFQFPGELFSLIEGYAAFERTTEIISSSGKTARVSTVYALLITPCNIIPPSSNSVEIRSSYPPKQQPGELDLTDLARRWNVISCVHFFPEDGRAVSSKKTTATALPEELNLVVSNDPSKRQVYDFTFVPAYERASLIDGHWDWISGERLLVQPIPSDNPNDTTIEAVNENIRENPQKFQKLLVESFQKFELDPETSAGEQKYDTQCCTIL